MVLRFNVKNQTISRTDNFNVVADSRNYLTAEFTFSDEWTMPVTAVFGYGGIYYNVFVEDGCCIVPWEVIKAPFFTVTVFCGDRVTANVLQILVEKSGYAEGKTPNEPTPDVYSKLVKLSEETKNIAQSVRDDADNGVFDGADGQNGRDGVNGINGKDGKDGYTPQKGIDYFDGKDGKDGAKGENGYTPIKGVDYFDGKDGQNGADGQDYILTENDKIEIANAVRNEYFNDIETGLDSIIAIQNELIGGESV